MKKKLIGAILIAMLCFTACNKPEAKPEAQTKPADASVTADSSQDNKPAEAKAKKDEQKSNKIDELNKKYIEPLGLTSIISTNWSSPEEIDCSDVLITLEIKLVDEKESLDKYLKDDGNLYIPQDYANQYFGISPEQLRASDLYNSAEGAYVVPLGLGGAWSVKATDYGENNDILEIQYDTKNALDTVSAKGTLTIQLNNDGTYRYISNSFQEEIYYSLTFPSAEDFELEDGKATMNSGGLVSVGSDSSDMADYDGKNLDSIISFYESTLEQLGLTGIADKEKNKGGWYWSGTYDGNTNISIDVQLNTSGEVYKITILF